MIPSESKITPLTSKKIETIDGQPAVGSPYNRVRMTIINIATKDPIDVARPTHTAIERGASEKEIIPSIEYWSNFQKDQLVSPATRSRFSYSRYLVL